MKIYRINYLLGGYEQHSACIVSKKPLGKKGLAEKISEKHSFSDFDKGRLSIESFEEITKEQLFLSSLTFSEFIILLESVV